MNYKLIFLLSTITITFLGLLVVSFLQPRPEYHHHFLRAVLPTNCFATGKPYLEKQRIIARKVFDIYLELSNGAKHNKPASPKILLQLKGIVAELDPAFKLSQDREPTEPDNVNTSVLLDVCPEKYMGEKYGYPFYHKGWEMQKCNNVRPLEKVNIIFGRAEE